MHAVKKLTFILLLILLLVTLTKPIALKLTTYAQNGDLIPDNYIVVLKEGHNPSSTAKQMGNAYGVIPKYIYQSSIKGFSVHAPKGRILALKKDPRVKFVSQDQVVSINPANPPNKGKKPTPTPTSTLTPTPTPIVSITPTNTPSPTPSPTSTPTMTPTPTPTPIPSNQATPSGVLRIGKNNSNTGTGIGVAVIDTGIDLTHPDLEGNIVAGTSCINGNTTGNDDHGHGSHVAGTIAAVDNNLGVVGVAPEAKLIAVKVLNSKGSGTWSSVICGIDWVTAHASTYNIKVANMSLGGSGTSDNNCGNTNSDALHQAICNSTNNSGVTYVVAAGNSSANANNERPASYNDTVITISALADSDGIPGNLGPTTGWGPDDTFATFSNYGNVVDLGAPGVNIYSTWKNSAYNTISGTSMASPHVAGAAALYLATHPGSSWTQIRDGLRNIAETLNNGHSDPSGLHPEPIVLTGNL